LLRKVPYGVASATLVGGVELLGEGAGVPSPPFVVVVGGAGVGDGVEGDFDESAGMPPDFPFD